MPVWSLVYMGLFLVDIKSAVNTMVDKKYK